MYRGMLLLVLLVFPSVTHGAVRISEIMYDAPGTDAGREWFEVQNTGGESIDLSTLFFFEADTHHKMTHVRGVALLPPQAFAVVVDDVDAFLAEYPGYSGSLFDSSWSSFSNDGEAFEIRDADSVAIDRVSYTSGVGAGGDGFTLHGSNSTWRAAAPSPGSAVMAESSPSSAPVGGAASTPAPPQSTVTTSGAGSGGGSGAPSAPPHAPKVSAGGNRTVFAQVATEFAAMLTGVAVEAKPFASYRWNFGNGEEVLKRALLYRYVRPGTYVVSVSVSTGGVTAFDRIVVTVIPTDVSIVHVGVDGIELRNGASKDLDLTDWQLRVGSILFTFPKDTVLMAGKSLFFESRITKLDTTQKSTVDVLFPTGEVAVSTQERLVHEPLEVVTQKEKPPPRKEVVSKKSSPPQKKISQASKKNNVVETAVVKELSSSGPGVVASSATSGPQVASVSNVSSGGLSAGYAIVALVALLGLSSSVIFLMKAETTVHSEGAVDGVQASAGGPVASEGAPSVEGLTIVARPKKAQAHEKTNEADSYTIVE